MTPELNREYPELDDQEVFEHMTKLTVEHMQPIGGQMRRGQHAKATCCVTAEFRVADDVPADLRRGVFREPGRVFDAVVRFSNSQDTIAKDGMGTARGLALKLLEVDGERVVAEDGDRSQDFLMVDYPVFPFATPKEYLETIRRKDVRVVGGLLAFAHMAVAAPKELEVIKAIRSQRVGSPLEIRYWSGSPYWLGPASGEGGLAVKYSAIPRQGDGKPGPEHPEDLAGDYLTQAVTRYLEGDAAEFEFCVQLQKDAVKMPIEDVSVAWSEEDSPPKKVATIRIPAQKVDMAGSLAARCETMSFSPWHALAEHRPMGGMNRLRRVVYAASVAKRSAKERAAESLDG
jgi:catalase